MMDGPITYRIVEIIASCVTVAVLIVVWFFSIFQTKRAARESERALKSHILKLEGDHKDMQVNIAKIGSDVSYIRGRLEPKA